MDALKNWRQPAAFVVLGALITRLVIGLVALVVQAGPDGFGSFPLAASSVAFLLMDGSGLVVLALLVAACGVRDPTSHARFLAAAGMVVSAASVLLTLTFALVSFAVGWGSPRINILLLLTSLAAPIVTTVGLGMLWRALARAARVVGPVADPEAAASLEPSTEVARTAPVWAPDEASGAVWHTAGAAAAGDAAASWGRPDASTGWNPVPDPPAAAAVEWSRAAAALPPAGDPGPDWAPPSESRPPER